MHGRMYDPHMINPRNSKANKLKKEEKKEEDKAWPLN